jgi:LPXTG-motif cell wall-anchored protein
MQYPHWLMVAGAVLMVLGFIGFAFRKNNAGPVENNPEQPNDEVNPARRERDAEQKAKGK